MPPKFSEHANAVLAEFGYWTGEIDDLIAYRLDDFRYLLIVNALLLIVGCSLWLRSMDGMFIVGIAGFIIVALFLLMPLLAVIPVSLTPVAATSRAKVASISCGSYGTAGCRAAAWSISSLSIPS